MRQRRGVPEVSREDAIGDQLLDMADALIARTFELSEGQAGLPIGRIKLLGAPAGVPFRLKGRQHAGDLGEIDTIGARVRAGVGGNLDPAARNHVGDDLGDVADAVVVLGAADIERLIADAPLRRFERGDEGARDVLDMHDRAPGRPVGFEVNQPCGDRPGHEVIEHDVEPECEATGRRRSPGADKWGKSRCRRTRQCRAPPAPWTCHKA